MKKEPETITFAFEEVDLEEVRNLSLAGDGKYAGLKQYLLDNLPKLSPEKTLTFGLPDKRELPVNKRTSLIHNINMTLKDAELAWKISYMRTKKLFMCIPKQPKKGSPPQQIIKTGSSRDELRQAIALQEQGLNNKAIADKMGIKVHRLDYLLYTKRKLNNPVLQKLIDQAYRIFNADDLWDMPVKTKAEFRRVVSIIGVKDLNLPRRLVARSIGCSVDNIYLTLKNKDYASPELTALRTAMKKEPS